MPEQSLPTGAVFLSYASQDADAAARICEALRAAGVEVWFDRSELRGGDAWDSQIKKQIHDCALFIPLISAHTNARIEGYFRGEWTLATRRLVNRAHDAAFLMPVVIDDTREADARVPEEFLRAQWTWLSGGEAPPTFAEHVRQLLGLDPASPPTAKAAATGARPSARGVGSVRSSGTPLLRRLAIPLTVLLVVLGGVAIWYIEGTSEAPAPTQATTTVSPSAAAAPNDKSIAVLPFVDMSAAKDQEHMSDGIAEELLNLLAQAPDLKVIARTSSFAFKGQNIEVSEIAKRLNVAHVLEGSVRTSGDKVRVTAQLVRTSDSTHLWSERYDRPMNDIFAIQDEIAKAIVQALQIRLKGGTLSRRAGGTQNLAAYQLYLQAVAAAEQNTKASLDAAEDYAQEAIQLDPNYGLAWLHLATVAGQKLNTGYLSTREGYEQIENFTKHALQLSPDIAEAHLSLTALYLMRDFNWPAAMAELQRAVDIDPTNTEVVLAVAEIADIRGNTDNLERQVRAAMQRDPLDFSLEGILASIYFKTDRLAEAEAIVRSAIERQPDKEFNHSSLAQILVAQGKVKAALAELELEPNESARVGVLPILLHAAGRQAEAEAALKALINVWADEWATGIAKVYACMGNHDRAMEWLERGYHQKDMYLYTHIGGPCYKGLADDPRYKAFLRNRLRIPT